MLIKMLTHILASALALFLLPHFVPGISVDSFYTAAVVAVIWGLLSVTVRPLLNLLALPINIITFGLFSFVISALLLWFVASFVQGFGIAGFIPALLCSVVLAGVSWVLHRVM